jgi:hypothetical protein
MLISLPLFIWLVRHTTFLRSNASSATTVIDAGSGVITGNAKKLVNEYGTTYVQLNGDNIFTYGSDYNMTHRCVHSVSPGLENGYDDKTDCPLLKNYWMIANESEKNLLSSCPGPVSQSLPYNSPDSPISFEWLDHIDEFGRPNLVAHLKTDLINKKHPCGDGYFTWNTIHAFGPFPDANKTILTFSIWYNETVKEDSSNRILVGWKINTHSTTSQEIELDLTSVNFGYNRQTKGPIVSNYYFDLNNSRHQIGINTQALPTIDASLPAITLTKGVMNEVHLDLYKIFTYLVSAGLIPNEPNGYSYNTSGIYIGSESGSAKSTDSVLSDLKITNVRIEEAR